MTEILTANNYSAAKRVQIKPPNIRFMINYKVYKFILLPLISVLCHSQQITVLGKKYDLCHEILLKTSSRKHKFCSKFFLDFSLVKEKFTLRNFLKIFTLECSLQV